MSMFLRRRNAIRRYGWENFTVEVVAVANTLDELCKLERHFIAHLGSIVPNGYNLTVGGEHIAGWHHTEQVRANISAALKGKPFTEAHKEALRQVNLGDKNLMYGQHLSDAHKANARAAISVCLQTGERFPSMTDAAKAFGISRTAVSLVCHGHATTTKGFSFRFLDSERAQRIADRFNENRRVISVAVVCIETHEIFPSMKAAAASFGLKPSSISSVCRGRSRTAGGYHWKRLEQSVD